MANLLSIWFPFQAGVSTFPRQANDNDAISASIIQILTTRKGERCLRPTFGTVLWDYLFESDSDSYRDNLQREVRSALTQWEPRIVVSSVQVEVNDANEPGQTLITVFYVILQSGAADSVTVGG